MHYLIARTLDKQKELKNKKKTSNPGVYQRLQFKRPPIILTLFPHVYVKRVCSAHVALEGENYRRFGFQSPRERGENNS